MTEEAERGNWGRSIEFVLTCIGFAVGLGNVWRFPFLTFQNGGGAFLIPYVLMLFLCGIPLFFLELSFGQFASLGPLSIWNKLSPIFKGVGISLLILCICINLTYGFLLATILYFLFASMTSDLPWSHCENRWNTRLCAEAELIKNKTILNEFLERENITNEQIKTPSEEYYYNEVLQISRGIDEAGPVVWQLASCLFICWAITYLALIKGISSLGKVVYFTSTFPYVMLIVMIGRGATLDGSLEGVTYYLKPDVTRLVEANVWSAAASQILYSISCCSGGLIAMASFNKFHNNVIRNTYIIPFINCGTSVLAGFAIFSVLGFMAKIKDVNIRDVAASGPGLVFVVYPEGLSHMNGAPIWSVLFFLMMLVLGLSTHFSQCETMISCLVDEFPEYLRTNPDRQLICRALSCTACFVLSLPMVTQGGFYLFTLADEYTTSFPRLIIGMGEITGMVWVYGLNRFCEDVEMMVGQKPNKYFKASLFIVMPFIIMAILLFKFITFEHISLFNGEYMYPAWGDALAVIMLVGVVAPMPLWFIGRWIYSGNPRIMESMKPHQSWGPARAEHRTGRYALEGHPTYKEDLAFSNPEVILENGVPITNLKFRLAPNGGFQSVTDQTRYSYQF